MVSSEMWQCLTSMLEELHGRLLKPFCFLLEILLKLEVPLLPFHGISPCFPHQESNHENSMPQPDINMYIDVRQCKCLKDHILERKLCNLVKFSLFDWDENLRFEREKKSVTRRQGSSLDYVPLLQHISTWQTAGAFSPIHQSQEDLECFPELVANTWPFHRLSAVLLLKWPLDYQ